MSSPEPRPPVLVPPIPESGLLNVQALSDRRLTLLGRGLFLEMDRQHEETSPEEDVDLREEVYPTCDLVASDIASLLGSDPERGEALIRCLGQSIVPEDRDLASRIVPYAARWNYDFAVEVLFAMDKAEFDIRRRYPEYRDRAIIEALGFALYKLFDLLPEEESRALDYRWGRAENDR